MSESPHPSGRRLRQCDAFHHIPFRPVPVRTRHDGWTPARQRGFIDRLCLTGDVARAARAVGKTPQSAYRLRDHAGAGSFARAWDQALASGISYQIDVSLERSLLGERVPIVRNGVCIGEKHRFDNRLAIATLNALDRRAARTADPAAMLERFLSPLDDPTQVALKNKDDLRESTSPSSTLDRQSPVRSSEVEKRWRGEMLLDFGLTAEIHSERRRRR